MSTPRKYDAVCLFSGGMDSGVTLSMALKENRSVLAVSCLYGSKHSKAEMDAAARFVLDYQEQGYDLDHVTIQMPDIFSGGGSALMGEAAMPALTYKQIAEGVGPSPTVVPFRNANLISAATTLAVVHEASWLYAGMHAEDARGWAYPDCTFEFLGAMGNAIRVGTYDKVRFRVPFVQSMKTDIVRVGFELGTPFDKTWSCYAPVTFDGTSQESAAPVHCGTCPTCIERIEAFQKQGLIDPVEYATVVDWDNCDPIEV